ncbi:hypothetical protein D3C76_1628810 [compost metagenome]
MLHEVFAVIVELKLQRLAQRFLNQMMTSTTVLKVCAVRTVRDQTAYSAHHSFAATVRAEAFVVRSLSTLLGQMVTDLFGDLQECHRC